MYILVIVMGKYKDEALGVVSTSIMIELQLKMHPSVFPLITRYPMNEFLLIG